MQQFDVDKSISLSNRLALQSTLADAVLDRIVHDAYKINLEGESRREQRAKLRQTKVKKSPENDAVVRERR
jgi:DNA replication protein DnaC